MDSLQTDTARENPTGAAPPGLECCAPPQSQSAPVEALLLWLTQQGFDPAQQAAIIAVLGMTAPALSQVPWEQFKSELREQYTPQLRSRSQKKGIEHALGVLEAVGVQRVADLNSRLIARVVSTRDKSLSPILYGRSWPTSRRLPATLSPLATCPLVHSRLARSAHGSRRGSGPRANTSARMSYAGSSTCYASMSNSARAGPSGEPGGFGPCRPTCLDRPPPVGGPLPPRDRPRFRAAHRST